MLATSNSVKIIIFSLLYFYNSSISYAQQNDAQAAFFNIGTGALVGGFGAVINKKPNEKIPRLFLNGMWKGAIGGFCVYGSKKLVYSFGQHNNYALAWSSKLLNAAGTSVIENASANQKFLTTWHFNFGFNRVEFKVDKGLQVNYKVMPFALNGFIYSATGASFNLSKTLQVGQPVFFADSITTSSMPFEFDGITNANSITIRNVLKDDSELLSHEIIHCYQYEGLGVFNTYFDKPRAKIFPQNKWVTFYKKWIYTDVNYLLFSGLYLLEGVENQNYYDNLFEREADFYSFKESYH